MSKTPKPLVIFVGRTLWSQAWVEELRAKGHTVYPLEIADFDLLLDPRAARFVPGMQKFLDSFIKGARIARDGTEKESSGAAQVMPEERKQL